MAKGVCVAFGCKVGLDVGVLLGVGVGVGGGDVCVGVIAIDVAVSVWIAIIASSNGVGVGVVVVHPIRITKTVIVTVLEPVNILLLFILRPHCQRPIAKSTVKGMAKFMKSARCCPSLVITPPRISH